MKIILIPFVYVIFSSEQNNFWPKRGEIQNFKKLTKFLSEVKTIQNCTLCPNSE